MPKNKRRILKNFTRNLHLQDVRYEGSLNSLDLLFMQDRKKESNHIDDTYAATFYSAKNIISRPFLGLGRQTIKNLLKIPGDLPYQLMTLCLNEDVSIPSEEKLTTKLPLLDELSAAKQKAGYEALIEKNSAKINANFVQAFKKLGQSPNFFDLSNVAHFISRAFLGFFFSSPLCHRNKTTAERKANKKYNLDLETSYLSYDITINSKLILTFNSHFNPRLANIFSSYDGSTINLGKFHALFDGEIEVIYKMDLTRGEEPEAVLHKIIFSEDSSEEFIAAFEMLFYGHDLFDLPKIVDDEENPIKNKNFLAKVKLLKNFILAKKQIAQERNIRLHKLDLANPEIRRSIKTRMFAFGIGFDLSVFTKKDNSTIPESTVDSEDDDSIYSMDDTDTVLHSPELANKSTTNNFNLGNSTTTDTSLKKNLVNIEKTQNTNSETTPLQNTVHYPSSDIISPSNSLQVATPAITEPVITKDLKTSAQLVDEKVTDDKIRSESIHETTASSTPVIHLYDATRSQCNSISSKNNDMPPLAGDTKPSNFEATFIKLAKEAATQYLDMFKWEPGNRRKVIWKKINPINHHGKHGRERAQRINEAQESTIILGVIKESLVSGNKDEQSLNGYLVEKLQALNSGMERKNIKDDLTILITFIEEQTSPETRTKNGSVVSFNGA